MCSKSMQAPEGTQAVTHVWSASDIRARCQPMWGLLRSKQATLCFPSNVTGTYLDSSAGCVDWSQCRTCTQTPVSATQPTWSKSASSQMIRGLFPPSSKVHSLRVSAAACMTICPAALLPVKPICRQIGLRVKGRRRQSPQLWWQGPLLQPGVKLDRGPSSQSLWCISRPACLQDKVDCATPTQAEAAQRRHAGMQGGLIYHTPGCAGA